MLLECGTAQFSLSLFVLFPRCSRYFAFVKLIHLNDFLDNVTFLFLTNQKPRKNIWTDGCCPFMFSSVRPPFILLVSLEFYLVLKSLNSVSRNFWGCSEFQGCFKGVSRKFQGCLKEVLRVFTKCFKKFQGCFKEILKKFPKCFKNISRKFSRKIEGCLKGVFSGFQWY